MGKQKDINDNKRLYMDTHDRPKPNVVRISTHNTLEHELIKAMVVYAVKKERGEAYTEAKWDKHSGFSGIADVFIPENPSYIEILCSETDSMLKKKCENYPDMFQGVIRVEEVMSDADRKALKEIYNRVVERII